MRTKVIIELTEHWLKVCIGRKVVVEPLSSSEGSAVLAALNSIFKQNKLGKDTDVFVVLNRNKITVRRVDLPSQDPKEIEQMLGLYLMRQIPYHKDEVCWAYQNLGFDGVSNSNLILAVALKNVFKNIVNALAPADILPESILMSSQGLIHYVAEINKDKNSLAGSYFILDVDANYSDLVLVHNSNLGSSVVIPQGAQQLKSQQDQEKFASELKQALAVLNNEVPGARCERLFLTGSSGQQLNFIEEFLAKGFNLKAQYLASKEYDSFVAAGIKDLSLSAVLGFGYQIAKEDIRFVVPELQIKKEMKSKMQQLMMLGMVLVYILISFGGIALVRLIQQQSYATSLSSKVATLSKDAKDLEDITSKLKIARQYMDPKASALSFLYALSRFCPESITITNYNWEWKKSFSFRGYARQIPDILAFTETLSNSEAFKGAQNRYTRRRKLKDKDVVDFEIVVK